MKYKMNRKALTTALALSAGLGMSAGNANAASYYYSLFEITDIMLEAEYWKESNGTPGQQANDSKVWARPGSNENYPRSATFESQTGASNSAGGSQSWNSGREFQQHVPPPGTFPMETQVAQTGVSMGENNFGQNTATPGQFSRADALINTSGIEMNPFGVFQSAGENAYLVVEGRSTSPTLYSSNARNRFGGFVDFTDLDFDTDINGDGIPDLGVYDGTNLGWTGRVRLSFAYHYNLELSTDPLDPVASATRGMLFNMFQDTSSGTGNLLTTKTLVAQAKTGFNDYNCDTDGDGTFGDDCYTDLGQTLPVSLGSDYSEESPTIIGPAPSTAVTGINGDVYNTRFVQTWNLFQNPINNGRYYYELTFDMNVSGTARSTSAVPEPGVLALLGLGVLGIGYARRRKIGG